MKSAIMQTAKGDHHTVHYYPVSDLKHIWDLRDMLSRTLTSKGELGSVCDFQTRIIREGQSPRLVITTTTLLDSVLLSILIDRVKKSKAQKCARPDCRIVFTSENKHKRKYCDRNCAHVESVRRDRERRRTS